jgi:hypothetical protein
MSPLKPRLYIGVAGEVDIDVDVDVGAEDEIGGGSYFGDSYYY